MSDHTVMRPLVVPDGLHKEADILVIAKRLYTEQRGRVVGNTPSWDELGPRQKYAICSCVDATLYTMRLAWSIE